MGQDKEDWNARGHSAVPLGNCSLKVISLSPLSLSDMSTWTMPRFKVESSTSTLVLVGNFQVLQHPLRLSEKGYQCFNRKLLLPLPFELRVGSKNQETEDQLSD